MASDASGYLALARIGMLELLAQLWERLAIVDEVCRELVVQHRDMVPDPRTLPWVDLVSVLPSPAVSKYRLDAGEAGVLSLAVSRPDEVLAVIDEKRGRRAADELKIRRTGVLGVLLEAKRRGLIPAIAPHIQALEDLERPFSMDLKLIERVLERAGESGTVIKLNKLNQKRPR